jgi:hypothetical protein
MWYRAFAMSETEVQPASLLEHLQNAGLEVRSHFRGDAEGWFEAQMVHDNLPLTLSRYLVSEEGVRAQLNTWAAWVELQEQNPHREHLMQQLIGVKQIFAMEVPDDEPADSGLRRLCVALCQHLATRTGGFYQIDHQGFFTADGTLLISEP